MLLKMQYCSRELEANQIARQLSALVYIVAFWLVRHYILLIPNFGPVDYKIWVSHAGENVLYARYEKWAI